MALSNTYAFGSNQKVDDIMLEAFERMGVIGNELTGLQTQSALRSMNYELTSWAGLGLNLWLVERQMFQLYDGQAIYTLPNNVIRLLEVTSTAPVRLNAGGTPSSSSGNPNNCFQTGNTAGTNQTAPNGNIAYDYSLSNTTPSIYYVGVQASLPNQSYTLAIENSFDNVNWQTVFLAPKQDYPLTKITWIVLENTQNARAWRIRETEGATLNVLQLYFSQPNSQGQGDRSISALSRQEYLSISNKQNQTNTQSSYYFDNSLQPNIILWPVPKLEENGYTNILYSCNRYPQDIADLTNNADVPQQFLDPLIAGTAARLAVKFAPDKAQFLKAEAQDSYRLAANTNFEDVPLKIYPDLGAYR